jgi:hypothetical protein
MKTKKLSKKLVLNKKTIANLKNDEMKGVYGGEIATTLWSNCILCSYPVCKD